MGSCVRQEKARQGHWSPCHLQLSTQLQGVEHPACSRAARLITSPAEPKLWLHPDLDTSSGLQYIQCSVDLQRGQMVSNF